MKNLILSLVLSLGIIATLAGFSYTAQAQHVPKENVEQISKFVFDHMAEAQLSDGTIVGTERAATLEYPLLPYEVREMLIIKGTFSGLAEVCGLNWEEKNYIPLMTAIRNNEEFNDYQIAYAGMLHGASMEGGKQTMQLQTPCTDEVIKAISDNMLQK